MNLPHIGSDMQIICAIINKYRSQIASTDDSDQINIDLYNKMLRKSFQSNPFREKCLAFSKRILKRNEKFNAKAFPKLSQE